MLNGLRTSREKESIGPDHRTMSAQTDAVAVILMILCKVSWQHVCF